MKASRFTESQIISILKQAESGYPVSDLCRETYHQEPNIQSPMNPIPEPPPRRLTEEEKKIQRILGIRRD